MKRWTPAEIQYLVEHYPHDDTKEICRHLSRSLCSVQTKAHMLGLSKTPEALSRIENGKGNWFKPGHRPHNAGVKGWDAGGRSSQTRFKSGNNPHNTGKDYQVSLRADGYLYIRLSLNHWVLYHRWLYEKVMCVKLRPEQVLRFKDGNQLNVRIENLQLIDQEQHMLLNSVHNYPPQVVELVRTIGILKRTINGKAREQHQSGRRTGRKNTDRGRAPRPDGHHRRSSHRRNKRRPGPSS